jgi:hypothetical protein
MTNHDKEFLEELFRENISPQRTRFNQTAMKTLRDKTVFNNSIDHSRVKMFSLKTEPNAAITNDFQFLVAKTPSPRRKLLKKTTVYFDAEEDQNNWFR